ncbi:MAG: 2-oxo-tetronate isomerase, partial [Rhodothermales bacterium]
MPRFAANLSTLFTEVPFLQRFERAAAAGFTAVEYLFPYDYDPKELRGLLDDLDLEQVLFNLPPGDWDAGDRGTAALPNRREAFRDSVGKAIEYARALRCTNLHAMAGIVPDSDRARCKQTFVENIRFAADAAAAHGLTILIEALNDRDVPGYLFAHQGEAAELVRRIDRTNVSVQLDYYHAQIMDGDLTRLTEEMDFGHVQIASVPLRHEPDEGEIDYDHVFATLDRVGYEGW